MSAPFQKLIEIMAKLRSPEGCPWDKEQTHDSIKGHLIEEAYEVVDALNRADFADLKEELGDLLLQVVFHAQLAAEAGHFNINDVVNGINEKLIRRHPHVFGEAEAKTAKEVIKKWEQIKTSEKERQSYLSGVPAGLPALAYAQKLQEKAARIGFDWQQREDILAKLTEEIKEFLAANYGSKEAEAEFGDILFTLVNLSRHLGIDAEAAAYQAAAKFRSRFEKMEAKAKEAGLDLAKLNLTELDKLWQESKEDSTNKRA